MQFGLEGGIAAGIVLATLYFAFAYAKSQVRVGVGAVRAGDEAFSRSRLCSQIWFAAKPQSACVPDLAPARLQCGQGSAILFVSICAAWSGPSHPALSLQLQVASIGVVDNARSSVVRTVEQQASAAAAPLCPFMLAAQYCLTASFLCFLFVRLTAHGPAPACPTATCCS